MLERIVVALIMTNRHQIDGESYEDFDLSTQKGIWDLAERAVKIKNALYHTDTYGRPDELGSVSDEPSVD